MAIQSYRELVLSRITRLRKAIPGWDKLLPDEKLLYFQNNHP